jgi:hypothetical protein
MAERMNFRIGEAPLSYDAKDHNEYIYLCLFLLRNVFACHNLYNSLFTSHYEKERLADGNKSLDLFIQCY